jgi:endoglucanase
MNGLKAKIGMVRKPLPRSRDRLRLKVRGAMRFVVLLFALLFPLAAWAAQDVTIRGRDFYLDGKAWLPKGLKVEAFARPAFIPTAPKWMNDPANLQGRKWWTSDELAAMKSRFGATVVRFAVSQPALDPQSSIYDPKYLDELLGVIRQARDAGFVVIPSMDAQAENGGSQSTVHAERQHRASLAILGTSLGQ